MHPIYLDCNSTAPLLPEVAAAMAEAEETGYANPASQHAAGRRAHRALEDAREEIARLLGGSLTDRAADRLIFTSGGTEANNLALLGITGAGATAGRVPSGCSSAAHSPGRLIISAIEHPSITAAADSLVKLGWQVDRLAVNRDGVVRLDRLDELLAAEAHPRLLRLVSVMLANNETGVIQPLAEIVGRCTAVGVPVHTDAVQAVGKIPVNFRELGVAAMTIAPHKFGGPRGIGALLVRHGVELQPILRGATQQLGLRPGTESVVLPIGFLAALRAWHDNRETWPRHLAELRDRFEAGVRSSLPLPRGEGRGEGACALASNATIIINGENAPRLPHTSNIAFVGHDRQALFMALDLAGLCCSTGSACASGSSEPSPTLVAMNLPNEIISSSLRFSLGVNTTSDDIEEAVRRIAMVASGRK